MKTTYPVSPLKLIPKNKPPEPPRRDDDRSHSHSIEASYTQAFRNLIFVRWNQRFDIDSRPYLSTILECPAPEMTLKCGRQVGKTTNIGGIEALHGAANPGYGHLYVAPRGDQAKTFSQLVFNDIVKLSPYLKRFLPRSTREDTWQIGMKRFRNTAWFAFRSAYHSADAIRGLSSGHIVKDEIQDLVSDHMAVIDECAANWPDARFLNAGTPKTFSNLLERKFQRSTQSEWLVKCRACQKWNYQTDKILGLKGYICERCGKPIDIADGQWVMRNPLRQELHQGFRITQFMNPNTQYWRIKEKLETYALAQFYNEVLGLSFSEGSAVLNREDVIKCCVPDFKMPDGLPPHHPYLAVSAGIDWGTGAGSGKRQRGETQVSFTVLTIGGYNPINGKWRVLYMKKFTGPDSELSSQPETINYILKRFRVQHVFSDWGFGEPYNRILINKYGWDPKRFNSIFEAHGTMKEFLKWNQGGNMYVVNRTEMFIKVIDEIKFRRWEFPCLEQMEPFISDFVSIYLELDAVRNLRKYDHTDPDDGFHSSSYAFLASARLSGQLSRWTKRLVYMPGDY